MTSTASGFLVGVAAGGGGAAQRGPAHRGVCWFVAYAAHALHRWPEHRAAHQAGDDGFTDAFAHEVRRF
jgi:hypothetical protein